MLRRLAHWVHSENGAVAPILVMLLIPFIGMVSLGTEVSGWYMKERQMQSAADSAALAAAATTDKTTKFALEAKGVATQYGYPPSANVTVTPVSGATCPDGSANCYQVTITQKVPLYLSQVVGYYGNTTLADGRKGVTVSATALVAQGGNLAQYCVIATDTAASNSLRINGGGNAVDFNGCSVLGGSDLTCNGTNSDEGMAHGDSVGSSSCGSPADSHAFTLAQFNTLIAPYTALQAFIPTGKAGCTPTSVDTVTQADVITGGMSKCGITLNSDLVFSGANDILEVNEGGINMNGHTISTTSGSSAGLTIIFTGTSQNVKKTTYSNTFSGGGTLDIQGPTTGNLKGVAILQSNTLTGPSNGPDMNAPPNLDLSGLIVLGSGSITLHGNIKQHTSGKQCFGVVARTILTDGVAGSFFAEATAGCGNFAYAPPVAGIGTTRQALVR